MELKFEQCPHCMETTELRAYLQWNSLRWLRCPICGGGIKTPYVTELESDADIVDSEYKDFYCSDEHFSSVAIEKSDWISKNLSEDMAIIEPGAGNGAVARAVASKNPLIQYFAIDPRMGKDASNDIPGIRIHNNPDPVAELTNVLYHLHSCKKPVLIFLDNTLEHIPYPVVFLKMLQRNTVQGSKVLIEVPNETGVKLRSLIAGTLMRKSKSPTFPGHVNLFTPTSLKAVCRAVGFSSFRHWINPLRTKDQVRYTMRARKIPLTVEVIRRLIKVFPLDSALGMGYWQRIEALL